MTAGKAVQPAAASPVLEMTDLVARIQLSDGPAQIVAPGGVYNFDTSLVAVPGPVNFTAADGYRMVTQNVAINLKTRRIAGAGGVSGTVPAGTFSAERIIGDLGERTVTLEGNARLRMTPGKMRMPR